jgi:hypothetical protein
VKISNTGHFKMLRTPEIAKIIIEFIGNKNTTANRLDGSAIK